MGMLGSRYFSDHPVIPLNRIVYNLNCDNGGYNDTTIFTIVGLGRTSADDDIKRACAAYGIKPTGDPDSTLHLFDRSDNVNFAKKGIPAPTFGMGVTGFDEKVRRYYHQLSDEFSSMDAGYVLKYIRSYIHAANNIANNPKQLKWRKGDKYEAAWKILY
jgi:Zn-dependent M28 family amino/carboxypeptidase